MQAQNNGCLLHFNFSKIVQHSFMNKILLNIHPVLLKTQWLQQRGRTSDFCEGRVHVVQQESVLREIWYPRDFSRRPSSEVTVSGQIIWNTFRCRLWGKKKEKKRLQFCCSAFSEEPI